MARVSNSNYAPLNFTQNSLNFYIPTPIQMETTVVPTFESADEILLSDHSNQTSPAVLSHDTIWFSVFFFNFRY